jgi:hypothetical protein
VLYGQVLDAGEPFSFRLLSGVEMQVRRQQVASLRWAQGEVVDGTFWAEDPNRTRLFFGPTARTLDQGTGYAAVYELYIPFLAYGLTDDLIVAGGTPPVPMDGSRVYWLAPKLRVYHWGQDEVAVGALCFLMSGQSESAGMLYGVATRSSARFSVTAGVGYAYWEDEISDTPVLLWAGETRLSSRVTLLSENYFVLDEGTMLSAGVRFIGQRLSADVGLAFPFFGQDALIFFPLVNFVWNF